MSIACLYDQFVGKPLPALGHRALVFSSISMRSFISKHMHLCPDRGTVGRAPRPVSLGQPDGIAQCFGPRKGGRAGVVTSRFRETICSPRPWGQLLSAQNIYRRAGRRAADRHHEQTQPVNCMQHWCGMLTQCSDHTLSGSTLFFTVP